jgi:transposase
MSTRRRVFPEIFKREAVDRVISSDLPVGKVATELGLNETVLRRWVMRLGGQATVPARRPITQAPAPSTSDLAAENIRLRRENERLRMERCWSCCLPLGLFDGCAAFSHGRRFLRDECLS